MATVGTASGAFVRAQPELRLGRLLRRLQPGRGDGGLRPRARPRPRLRAHRDDVLADALGPRRHRLRHARVQPGRLLQVPHHRLHARGPASSQYGGRARFPSNTWCLIDPLPSALAGVTFTGGRWTRRSSLSWATTQPRAPPGPRWRSVVARGRLQDAPSWAETVLVPRRQPLEWRDTLRDESDRLLPGQAREPLRRRPAAATACYRARMIAALGPPTAAAARATHPRCRPGLTSSGPCSAAVAGSRDGVPMRGPLWQTRGRAAPQHHYRLARRTGLTEPPR